METSRRMQTNNYEKKKVDKSKWAKGLKSKCQFWAKNKLFSDPHMKKKQV